MNFGNAADTLEWPSPPLAFVRAGRRELGSSCSPCSEPAWSPPVNTAVNAAWTYLVVAGLFEIGWPLGLKWAQEAQRTPALVFGIVVAVVAMGISGFLLYLAQREI